MFSVIVFLLLFNFLGVTVNKSTYNLVYSTANNWCLLYTGTCKVNTVILFPNVRIFYSPLFSDIRFHQAPMKGFNTRSHADL